MATVIWRFSDGKAGHDNQSKGLVRALSGRLTVNEYVLQVDRSVKAYWWWLTRQYPPGLALPQPDILVAAGHATHSHLLAARRRYGGRSVVLMEPSLPCHLFDLCIVPWHDKPASSDRIIPTQGVLNTIQPGGNPDRDTGLIAIGGPSKHFHWDNEHMFRQIEQLLHNRPKQHWRLMSSRRTPEHLLERMRGLKNVECKTMDEAGPDSMSTYMQRTGEIWVSMDSISMVYEALSSGARVGLLTVPQKGHNRIASAVDQLVKTGRLAAPGDWEPSPVNGLPLNEASRCADWIIERWLNET